MQADDEEVVFVLVPGTSFYMMLSKIFLDLLLLRLVTIPRNTLMDIFLFPPISLQQRVVGHDLIILSE